jgi:hypothetical protein
LEVDVLKAAGTPMIRPGPEANSVARLTFPPGFPSTSSMLGIASPTWTMIAVFVLERNQVREVGNEK